LFSAPLVLLNYLKYDNLSLISHHGLIRKESHMVNYVFFILKFHILMQLYPKKEMMIFDWFQGFSEEQMTKLKKNEHISAEREREIDQVI